MAMLSGCGSQQAYNKRYYMLNATREKESVKGENDSILEVRHFTIHSAFSGKGLVYRIGEFEYESDFYNELLISPPAMITETARTWLFESGLFNRVLDSKSQIDSSHLIEGNITELYGDFRDKSSPTAVMEMRIFLLKVNPGKDPSFVFGKTYKSTASVDSKSPEGLVKALGHCLEEIMMALEKDLMENLP
jgi:ABC-type uncharacterized transport system auxiliary subunit